MEFTYNCLDSSGKDSRGVISASDRVDALAKLRVRGLTVIEIREKERKSKSAAIFKKGFKDQDVYDMARELSTLLRSGIRIDRAFELLIRSTSKDDLKEILVSALTDIKAGKGVAQSFDNARRFNPFLISMIHVGEAVGDLQAAFENIAQYLKFQIQFKAEIKNAMYYPAFLIFVSFAMFIFMFNFIVPKFFTIFGTNSGELPTTAKILYTVSGLFSFTNMGILAVLIMALIIAKKIYPDKLKLPDLSGYYINIPIVGVLILNLEISRFSYSMYSMLQSGVEFIKALKMSASVIQNGHIRESIAALVGQIKEGKKIADVFSQVYLLPEIVPNMIRVGEESGNLKDAYFELHQIFDERFKNSIKRFLALIEPMIIVFMGLIVGFIVITLILTVMSVSTIKM